MPEQESLTERMEAIKRLIEEEEADLMEAELKHKRQRAMAHRRELQILYHKKDALARTYNRRVLHPF